MKKIFMIGIVLLTTLVTKAQNSEIHFEKLSLEEALTKAKAANKPVFVDCFTTWCIPCKHMEKNVFTIDSVANFYNTNFINVKIDMEKGEGPALRKKYVVEAYPSYLILNSDGKIKNKFVGGMSASEFLGHARKGASTKSDEAQLNARYESGDRSPAFLREYIKHKIKVMEISKAKQINNELMAILSPKEKASPENWFLFGQNRYTMYLSDLFSPNFKYMVEHWQDFAAQNTKDTVDRKISSVYRQIASWTLNGFYFKVKPYDKQTFELYKSQIKKTKVPDKAQLLVMMDIAMAAAEKNEPEVTKLFLANLGSFTEENRHVLFDYVTFGRSIKGYNFPQITALSDEIAKTSSNPFLVSLFKDIKKRYAAN
ncbi:thioredoxin family protein [Mucilaginibacter terrae]|uniref:Thiol-disulfide isomerase/thioredoxin n=1 Tax=Mucilaginibacter terrae TaxID=1955052 RepID=A0ABU3GUC5_9SPHI|nr:thioredoxin family protein [Mucilaginibacter terrae]MDT3402245.1 thiol-disulfide isomerase/thioredoxin [Mucilaginibacter terrae]